MNRDEIDNVAWPREALRGRLKELNRERFKGRGRDPEQRERLFEQIGAGWQQLGEPERALGAWERALYHLGASPERVSLEYRTVPPQEGRTRPKHMFVGASVQATDLLGVTQEVQLSNAELLGLESTRTGVLRLLLPEHLDALR